MKLALPIYFHTGDISNLENLDIDYDLKDCEIREVIFFDIAAISEYKEEGQIVGTRIHANGDSFLCSLMPKAVLKLIEFEMKDFNPVILPSGWKSSEKPF